MKKSRFTESQIVSILKEADAGAKVKEICRRHGISDATYYNWKSWNWQESRGGIRILEGWPIWYLAEASGSIRILSPQVGKLPQVANLTMSDCQT